MTFRKMIEKVLTPWEIISETNCCLYPGNYYQGVVLALEITHGVYRKPCRKPWKVLHEMFIILYLSDLSLAGGSFFKLVRVSYPREFCCLFIWEISARSTEMQFEEYNQNDGT